MASSWAYVMQLGLISGLVVRSSSIVVVRNSLKVQGLPLTSKLLLLVLPPLACSSGIVIMFLVPFEWCLLGGGGQLVPFYMKGWVEWGGWRY